MRQIIEFCANNNHLGMNEVIKKLKEIHLYEVIEYGCLTNCGMCYLTPYALVNGETVEAETASSLYSVILQKVKESI